ncbi:MAG: TonB-dependent receptor [Candidatus Cloacimonetes bacterium]|nr:TonB-dependent receptor [Candidatus Cloacimonadota bacterium]
MQKRIFLLLLFLVVISSVFAQTTGKLAGRVKDQDGNPVAYANVFLIGTEIGSQTNDKGQFVIINIPPGEYDVQISRGGFQSQQITGVQINLDETSIQNVVLTKTAIAIEGIKVVEARKELISKAKTSSGNIIGAETIENLAIDNIQGIVAIQAGASVVDGELHVRGGRPNEVVYSIDGMSVSDPVDGGAALTIDRDAILDMKVMTGGFSAEFGNAQSGIVNIITRDGTEYYSGKLEMNSDHIIPDVENSNSDVIKLSLGGPVLGPIAPALKKKFTFFFNGATNWHDSRYREYYNNNPAVEIDNIVTSWNDYIGYDPYLDRDDFIGFDLGDRNYNNYNANLKLKYDINPTTNVSFAMRGDQYENEPYAHNWKYALEHYAKTEGQQRQYIATYDHVYNPQMNLKVKASLYEKRVEQGPRGISRDMYFVKDSLNFVLIDPNNIIPGGCNGIYYLTDDGLIGNYQNYNWSYETSEGNQQGIPFVRPGSIFGSYFDDENQEISLKSDFEYQINTIHGFKTGLELKKHYIKKDRLFNPWILNANRFNTYLNSADPVVQYEAGDTLIIDDVEIVLNQPISFYNLNDIYNATLAASGTTDGYEANPWQGAFYLQDKMEWEGMIVNAGIRFDVWYLGGDYDIITPKYQGSFLDYINPDSELNSGIYLPDAEPGTEPYIEYHQAKKDYQRLKDRFSTPEVMISPRLGVSHPISERAVLHFAYNYQRQLPQMQYIFTTGRPQDVVENPSLNVIVGNPELEAQSTITYEAGLQYQLTEDYVLDITTYYKNIYNYVSVGEDTLITDQNVRWNIYESNDYGSARGIDINLQKLLSNFFSGSASYSLTWANGNHSETATDNEESLREFPLNWDIRHNFNLNFTFIIRQDEEFYIPFTEIKLPFDDFVANFTYNIASGVPYTPLLTNDVAGEANSQNQPHTETADLTLRKNFHFGDRNRFSVYMTIENLFNRTNYNSVYARTGSPYDSGTNLDFNNDGYVDPQTIAVYSQYDRDPRLVASGRTYNLGMSFSW